MICKGDDCGRVLAPQSKVDYCPVCRKAIKRERAERVAELPWYIFDRDDPTVAGTNHDRVRPVESMFRINMSKRKLTI